MGRGRHKEEFKVSILKVKAHKHMCVGSFSECLSTEVPFSEFRIRTLTWNMYCLSSLSLFNVREFHGK